YTPVYFFFQAEDGIRDRNVTGVQTCALPISQLPDSVEGMSEEQLSNAAIIMKAGEEAGLGERAQLIGIMTAMQESTLNNLDGGDRDSDGLSQHRPPQGWGTDEQLADPTHAA